MKLGMSTAAFYSIGETDENAVHLTKFPQLETCEVFLETWSEYSAAFGAKVKEKLNGLPVTSVHPKGTQFEPDLFGRSNRQTEDALKILTGVLDAGQSLGAKYYVMHGPGNIVTPRKPETIYCLAERMERMQKIAKEHGMEILWENVSWCAVHTPEQVRKLREILPEIGFVLDIKQAIRAGEDPMAMLGAMGSALKHVHVLDYHLSDGKLCLPGEGDFNWRMLFRTLKETGYAGNVILEPYEYLSRDDDRLSKSIAFLHQAIAEA